RGIDHLVIMFKELEPAIAAYRDLGFTVVPGGEHPVGTHNALVTFADGAYLELIAFKRPNDQHRWWGVAQAGGRFIDFCMATDDLAASIQAFRDAGVKMSDPAPAAGRGRTATSSPGSSRRSPSPSRSRRRSSSRTTRPARSASAKRRVTRTASPASPASRWRRTTWRACAAGGAPCCVSPEPRSSGSDVGAAGVRFLAGPHALDFVAPKAASSPIEGWLKTRGPSPYAIALKTSGEKKGALDESTAGTRITAL